MAVNGEFDNALTIRMTGSGSDEDYEVTPESNDGNWVLYTLNVAECWPKSAAAWAENNPITDAYIFSMVAASSDLDAQAVTFGPIWFEAPVVEETYIVYFDNSKAEWDNVYAYVADADWNYLVAWSGDAMTEGADNVWSYTFTTAMTPAYVIFSNGEGTQTEDLTFKNESTYTYEPAEVPAEAPTTMYLMGDCSGWPSHDLPAYSETGVFTWNAVVMPKVDNYFAFTYSESLTDWNEINALRYNAESKDLAVELGQPMATVFGGTDYSWIVAEGTYDIELDINNLTMTISEAQGDSLSAIETAAGAPAVYYNLQGVRVANPERGIYIRVEGNTAIKVTF